MPSMTTSEANAILSALKNAVGRRDVGTRRGYSLVNATLREEATMPDKATRRPAAESPARREHRIDAQQAAEALMASMKLNGIERLWFVSGSELAFFQEGAVKHRATGQPAPRVMTMTHENAALAAACGETVVTGRPSAAAFHVECGLINAGGAIHNADRGHYPVLIMSGYPPSAEMGSVPGARNSYIQWYQQIRDQGELLRQYVRWDHKLAPYDNAGLVITRAVQVMLSEPRGPAYLALPREAAMTPIDGARFPLIDHLRPAGTPAADHAELRQAAEWLLEAEQPLICVGRYGDHVAGVPALQQLAETLGARVMADPFRMSFPGNHPLHRGTPGILPTPPDSDCVLVIETVVPWQPASFNPDRSKRVIRLGIDPIERMTTIYEFPSDLSITADPAKAVPDLLEELRGLMTAEQRRRCQARAERYQTEGRQRLADAVHAAESDRDRGLISPQWLSHEVGQTLEPETIITHELIDSALFNRSRPGTLVGTGGSSIGFAAPAAIGVKVAAGDRPVVACIGDGSWMFANPQVTVWASAFHRAPVLFIVWNNRGYRTGTSEVLRSYPEGYAARERDFTGGWFDPCPNYSGEAAASGAYGEKVTAPKDVGPAIRRALDAVARDRVPAVLDMWMPKLVTGEV
jgi:acetolactate synthase I/II/III large subunit